MKKLVFAFCFIITLCFFINESHVQASELQFSNLPGYDLKISTNENKINISNISDDEKYKFIWIKIVAQNEKNSYSNVVENKNGVAEFEVTGIEDGIYFLEINHSNKKNTDYIAYLWGKKLKVEIKEGNIIFCFSSVLEHNKKVFNSKRTDNFAGDYYLEPNEFIQSNDPDIIKTANDITKGLTDEYSKTLAIHDWVCNNIWYDYDLLNERVQYSDISASGTLMSGTSTCEGYSNLTAALLQASGIPAKVIEGYSLHEVIGTNTENGWNDALMSEIIKYYDINHVWNEAFVDGRWIILDTTWDSRNKFEYDTFIENDEPISYTYFDITLDAFSLTHLIIDYKEDNVALFHPYEDIMSASTVVSENTMFYETKSSNTKHIFEIDIKSMNELYTKTKNGKFVFVSNFMKYELPYNIKNILKIEDYINKNGYNENDMKIYVSISKVTGEIPRAGKILFLRLYPNVEINDEFYKIDIGLYDKDGNKTDFMCDGFLEPVIFTVTSDTEQSGTFKYDAEKGYFSFVPSTSSNGSTKVKARSNGIFTIAKKNVKFAAIRGHWGETEIQKNA